MIQRTRNSLRVFLFSLELVKRAEEAAVKTPNLVGEIVPGMYVSVKMYLFSQLQKRSERQTILSALQLLVFFLSIDGVVVYPIVESVPLVLISGGMKAEFLGRVLSLKFGPAKS